MRRNLQESHRQIDESHLRKKRRTADKCPGVFLFLCSLLFFFVVLCVCVCVFFFLFCFFFFFGGGGGGGCFSVCSFVSGDSKNTFCLTPISGSV